MRTWWSAIDTTHSSYEEMKHRKIVAQGWRNLGDIGTLARFIPDAKGSFVQVIQLLGDAAYRGESWWEMKDRNQTRAPAVMWNLFSVERGDIVVALEGREVRGLCQVEANAADSYRYDQPWQYAQTIGFPVTWHDWDASLGSPPNAPNRGILGIRKLLDESDLVRSAWAKVQENTGSEPDDD